MSTRDKKLMLNLSILIPSYKAEKTLRRTLDCLINLSIPKFEIIVVEDGVYDNTQELVAEYDQVRFYSLEENHGACYARNYGLKKSLGEYVLFWDADDYCEDGFVEGLLSTSKQENADICFGRCRVEYPSGKTKYFHPPRNETYMDVIKRWLVGSSGPPTSGVLWRKDFILSCGAWNEDLLINQDGELMLRALAMKPKLASSARSEFIYWQGNMSSVSKSKSIKAQKSLISSHMNCQLALKNADLGLDDLYYVLYFQNLRLRLVTLGAKSLVIEKVPKYTMKQKVSSLRLVRGKVLVRYTILFLLGERNYLSLLSMLK